MSAKKTYRVEAHTTTEYMVVECDKEKGIRTPKAKCNDRKDAIELQLYYESREKE